MRNKFIYDKAQCDVVNLERLQHHARGMFMTWNCIEYNYLNYLLFNSGVVVGPPAAAKL
jgi:hypothetical protein